MARASLHAKGLLFGGRDEATPDGPLPMMDPLAPLLERLSWKYVKSDPDWPPNVIPADDDIAKWKEEIAHWAGRVWCHVNEMPEGPELRAFDIMSLKEQCREYLEHEGPMLSKRGLSIEEIWCSSQLHEAAPLMLLLNTRHAEAATERVNIKLLYNADALVWLLGAMCLQMELESPGINVLVTNGKSGHAIQISGMNGLDFKHPRGVDVRPGWFSLHDPWPAKSLLSPRHGYPIQVLEDITRPPLWLVSPPDLGEIIVGFIIPVDALQTLACWFKSLDAMMRLQSEYGTPLWHENPVDREALFPLMLSMTGGTTASSLAGYLGLGRYHLMTEDVDSALSSFECAVGIDRPRAVSVAAIMLKEFGHGDLVKRWAVDYND